MSMDLNSPDDIQRENAISGKANACKYILEPTIEVWITNKKNKAHKTDSSLSDEKQGSGKLMAVNEPVVC